MADHDMIIVGVNQNVYPQFLNKYRANSPFTKKIITDNELFFCNPLEFNDPYDCNTPISKSTPIPDIKKWLAKVGIFPEDIDHLAGVFQSNPTLMETETKKVLASTGICCFSTLEDSILQWSHYSDYHRGMCFKFDITEDPEFFFLPLIVHYKSLMQHYNHLIHNKKIVEYLIQAKFSDWSYESEVRVVKYPDTVTANKGRLFKFKSKALSEIIFGTNTSQSIIDEYMDLCKQHKPHVKFYRMKLSSGLHYGLEKHNL